MRARNPQRVAIVSDTTAYLLPEQVKEYDIEVVPV
jgi:fatty acid-binding protein DegV